VQRPLPPYSVLLPLAPWEPPEVVAEALESLAAQQWPAAEVVVSCDGAPPLALQQVLLASGLPVRLVEGPGGEGVGPVLARGLMHCSNELILRADADDLSLPQRSVHQLSQLQADPSLAVISAPIQEFIGSAERPCGLRTVPHGPEAVRRFSRWRNPINHPAVACRRSRLLAAGNYRAVPGFEDYDLWLRLLARGERLDNSATPLVLARVGPAHLGRRRGWRYGRQEAAFLGRCGREGILPLSQVLLLILLRVPLRWLPAAGLAALMGRWLRRPAAPSGAATRGGGSAAGG